MVNFTGMDLLKKNFRGSMYPRYFGRLEVWRLLVQVILIF